MLSTYAVIYINKHFTPRYNIVIMRAHTTEKKRDDLRRRLKERWKLLVAFSGGVDSGFLLMAAHDVLGENVLAVTIDSEQFPRRDLEHVRSFLKRTGIAHKIVQFSWMRTDDFVRNPYNRCYHCKKALLQILKDVAAEAGIRTIAEGVNASDFDEYRPGIAAAAEEGIWHPLAEVGLTKPEVRWLAKEIRLPFWDKPPSPCLATRIAYGEQITVEKLAMIEAGEDALKDLGFRQVRVRLHHGGIARIEVEKEEIAVLFDMKTRAAICGKLKTLGFTYVTLDLEGYRSGSMDIGRL